METKKKTSFIETIATYALIGSITVFLAAYVVYAAKIGVLDAPITPDISDEPEIDKDDDKWYTIADATKAISNSDMLSAYKTSAIGHLSKVPQRYGSSAFYEAIANIAAAHSMTSASRAEAIKELCYSLMK